MGTVSCSAEGCIWIKFFATSGNHQCCLLSADSPAASSSAWQTSKEENYTETHECVLCTVCNLEELLGASPQSPYSTDLAPWDYCVWVHKESAVKPAQCSQWGRPGSHPLLCMSSWNGVIPQGHLQTSRNVEKMHQFGHRFCWEVNTIHKLDSGGVFLFISSLDCGITLLMTFSMALIK